MRIKELATFIGFCPATLKRWIKAGKIKATKTQPQWGGHWYWDISQEDFDKYLGELNK